MVGQKVAWNTGKMQGFWSHLGLTVDHIAMLALRCVILV